MSKKQRDRHLRGRMRSQNGQMAIFIALIFQILFVFFAMVVNVGLIVHNKINLQNSVDIAAFYAAQRQAEVLNSIAHANYQIRQAWKLLAWRVWVLGDLGNTDHPLQQSPTQLTYANQLVYPMDKGVLTTRFPTICVNNQMWGLGKNQNLCKSNTVEFPEIPSTVVVAPFLAFNIAFQKKVEGLKDNISSACQNAGPPNFRLAVRWIAAYRSQVAKSKQHIRRLAESLSQVQTNFNDIHENRVYQGVEKTLRNNLTRSNLENLDFKILNGLGGIEREHWLHEVPIFPSVYYTDFQDKGDCLANPTFHWASEKGENLPRHCTTQNCPNLDMFDGLRNEPANTDHLYHSISGVEKNPWIMAYVGVKATTTVKVPFLPFGEPITLRARAFAKPFGGRIGPWRFQSWQRDQPQSMGNVDTLVDPLLPDDTTLSGSALYNAKKSIPNYSRFPGDLLGMNSLASLALMKEKIVQGLRSHNNQFSLNYYSGIPNDIDNLAMDASQGGRGNQSLSSLGYNAPWVRELELAAIAPDLFDIAYYSISPRYAQAYLKNAPADSPFDFGTLSRENPIDIDKHIELAGQMTQSPANFFLVKDVEHLMSGWMPMDTFNYDGIPEEFGRCKEPGQVPVPGGCAIGGRSGYSVKIVSKDQLFSDMVLGGQGAGAGKILNPPPEEF